jgi:molybdenum cofactor cytidylyltransferase
VDVGVVLAGAGFSKRFGKDKRVTELGGNTLAGTTINLYQMAFERLRIVIRPEDELEKLAPSFRAREQDEVIRFEKAELGMGHTIARGFSSLAWDFGFLGFLDMPFIQQETLEELKRVAVSEKPKILRPVLTPELKTTAEAEKRPDVGHPVGFSKDLFPLLGSIQGDVGAKTIISSHEKDVKNISVDDYGIVMDVDSPQDLAYSRN